MEAHLQAAEGRNTATIPAAYDHAIKAASRSGYDHDAALGSQLAAEYCLSVMERLAKDSIQFATIENLLCRYVQEARQLYKSWGAIALVKHLEARYDAFFDRCSTQFFSSDPISGNASGLSPETDTLGPMGFVPGTGIPDGDDDANKEEVSVLTMDSFFLHRGSELIAAALRDGY